MTSLLFLFSLILLQICFAHTFLSSPDAYQRKFQITNCKGSQCSQACPSESGHTKKINSAEKPAKTWKRGEEVKIKWARNNHNHGFIRFTIVPVSKQMDRKWHEKLAFWYGCFGQGKFKCSPAECGADNLGYGYSAKIKVPTYIPDGVYVFGLVWYGGVHQPISDEHYFPDYWSCSFVQIKGGKALGGEVKPNFHPSEVIVKNQNKGECFSAIDVPEVCPDKGCGPPKSGLPKPFQGKMSPKAITVDMFRAAMK